MPSARVMIVEDENIVAMDIKQRLEMLGYEVVATVTTGEEAVKLTEKTRPDIILMDIVLKGEMDGIEAAEEIKRRFKIPIIYITAYSDEETLERAKITEPFGYIIKPFEDRELHSVIEISLYKNKMERKLRESEERYRAIIRSLNDVLFTLDSNGRFTMVSGQIQDYGLVEDEIIGKTPREVFGASGQIHHEKNQEVLKGESIVYQWKWEKDGENLYFIVSLSPLRGSEGEIIGITGILKDITSLKEYEMALEKENEISRALANLAKKLLKPISIEKISDNVIEYARKLTDSQFCIIGVFDEGELEDCVIPEETLKECNIKEKPRMERLCGWILENREPIISNDPQGDRRAFRIPEGHVKIENFLVFPALLQGELVGIIALANKDGVYDEKDLEVVERLADLYSIAIKRKLDEEKNRIIIQKFLKIVSEVLEELK
ncbi:sensory transduction regulatory protein [Methanothermobacter sp. MT-2]|nr:sensory transduction regulatory protein [Methanothermobacter sp. MT-2]HHW04913.1 response regulator [Methanothermobacter sp.]